MLDGFIRKLLMSYSRTKRWIQQ